MTELDLLETLARAAAALAAPQTDTASVQRILAQLPAEAGIDCRLWQSGGGLEVEWLGQPTRGQLAFVDALGSCVAMAIGAIAATSGGMLDPAGFAAAGERAVAAARWRGEGVSMAVFDVAGLILSPGIDAGDAVAEVGTLAAGAIRQSDSVGNLGGGRFALLFPRAGTFEARAAFRRVSAAIAAGGDGDGFRCGPAGFAELGEQDGAETLLATALERLSAARVRRSYTAPVTDPDRPLAG